jgi:hypothetical protein
MNKVVCYPRSCTPTKFDDETSYFELFSYPAQKTHNVGCAGAALLKQLRKSHIVPTIAAFDFTIIALSVAAADKAVLRRISPDGWTRIIELTIFLHEADRWNTVKEKIALMLRFLTGDFWSLNILPIKNSLIPNQRYPLRKKDCICLLSGGVDSLVGAIDLSASKRNPLFVSQIVRGDAGNQREFAGRLGEDNLCQWSCSIQKDGTSENSTRARSIVFFAYALLASCGIAPNNNGRKEVFVPENGFISLNIPLGANRIGSLSTKTTHPIYMAALQEIWNYVGIDADLILPYKYKTKGEVLIDCKNQEVLLNMIYNSTSCGKFHRHGYKHCGVCVPCLVRRAAFMKAGIDDNTQKGYETDNLKNSQSSDLAVAGLAVMEAKKYGIDSIVKSELSFADNVERQMLIGVILRGISELENLLKKHGVI